MASVAALAVSGLFLFDHSSMKAYSIVFGISFLGGAISLYFLNRVPDPLVARAVQQKPHVQWLTLLRDNTFVRLLVFSMAVQTFVASIATFVTVFVRDQVQLQDGTILWLTAGAALLGTLAMRLLRHRVDRFGSRPFLGIVFLWWVVYFLTWFLLAANVLEQPLVVAPVLMLMAGFFGAIYDLALTRLLMNTVGDRTHSTEYFALHSVLISLMMGVSPILWGLLLEDVAWPAVYDRWRRARGLCRFLCAPMVRLGHGFTSLYPITRNQFHFDWVTALSRICDCAQPTNYTVDGSQPLVHSLITTKSPYWRSLSAQNGAILELQPNTISSTERSS